MFTTRPEIAGTFGVAASTHWIASQTAMAVLERGGNAFDAAAAAGFVLQVAEPHLNGPGGDAPIIIHDAAANAQHVICGQGVSPDAATLDRFASLGLDLVPGTGLLPAMVPGAFDAWCLMLRDWGTFELADVLEYALGYATNGVHVLPRISATIESVRPMFEQEWMSSAAVFLPRGEVPVPGSLFANPALAATYSRIVHEAVGSTREARIDAARNAWYRGFVAEAIDRFFRTQEVLDTSGRRHRGLLTADDMARWQPTIEAPLTYDYGRYTVCKPGVWSQGPVMLQQLALLKGFELDGLDPAGPEFIHLQTECAKLAFADRFGDEAMRPGLARAFDLRNAVGAGAFRLGQDAGIGFRQRLVGKERAGFWHLIVRQIDRGRRCPVLPEHLFDGGNRRAGAFHQRVAVAGIGNGGLENVAQPQRAVVAQQQHPGFERAGNAGGQEPGSGHHLQAFAAVMRDGGALGSRALAANHLGAAAFDIVHDDRHVAAGAVQMRFHDLQRERRGNPGVERIAAPLQDTHSDRGGDPVGGGHDPERAFDLRPGGEGIGIDVAHWNPVLFRGLTGGALDHSQACLPTGPVPCAAPILVIMRGRWPRLDC